METKNAPIISPEILEKLINSLTECFILECEQCKINTDTPEFSDRAHAMLKAIITTCKNYYQFNNAESKQDNTYALQIKNIGYDMIESYCNCIRTKCNLDLIMREFYDRRKTYDALNLGIETMCFNSPYGILNQKDSPYEEPITQLFNAYEKDTANSWNFILNHLEEDTDDLKRYMTDNA